MRQSPAARVFSARASSALTEKKRDYFYTLFILFFQQTFLFNFFEVTKDFQAKEKMMGTAESQKALFIVVTTTAGKEIF